MHYVSTWLLQTNKQIALLQTALSTVPIEALEVTSSHWESSREHWDLVCVKIPSVQAQAPGIEDLNRQTQTLSMGRECSGREPGTACLRLKPVPTLGETSVSVFRQRCPDLSPVLECSSGSGRQVLSFETDMQVANRQLRTF